MTNTLDTLGIIIGTARMQSAGLLSAAIYAYGDVHVGTPILDADISDARLAYLEGKAHLHAKHGLQAWVRMLDDSSRARLAAYVELLAKGS